MKNILILLFISLSVLNLKAQERLKNNIPNTQLVFKNNLQVVFINELTNLMIRSPEEIQFVDMSSNRLIGDLPTETITRIKLEKVDDEGSLISYLDQEEIGIITITGQSFMAQYRVIYKTKEYDSNVITNIEVLPNQMQPLEYPKIELSNIEMKEFSMKILKEKTRNLRQVKGLKMKFNLNNVYTVGDYVFLDITFKNNSNLSYSIDNIKFSIDDKKIYKATNNQSIEIEPVYMLYRNKVFLQKYRNVFVFKKFTFPNNKILSVRLIEEQISGRTLDLEIKYKDILNANTL